MTYVLVRIVKTPLGIDKQRISLNVDSWRAALTKAAILNDPQCLNPKVKIVRWWIEYD